MREELGSGWFRVIEEGDGRNVTAEVTIDGKIRREYSGEEMDRRWRRELGVIRDFFRRFGPIDVPDDPNFVPIEVAIEGKPAICAYLFGVHGMEKMEIADRLSVKERTVVQYLSKFAHNRR